VHLCWWARSGCCTWRGARARGGPGGLAGEEAGAGDGSSWARAGGRGHVAVLDEEGERASRLGPAVQGEGHKERAEGDRRTSEPASPSRLTDRIRGLTKKVTQIVLRARTITKFGLRRGRRSTGRTELWLPSSGAVPCALARSVRPFPCYILLLTLGFRHPVCTIVLVLLRRRTDPAEGLSLAAAQPLSPLDQPLPPPRLLKRLGAKAAAKRACTKLRA